MENKSKHTPGPWEVAGGFVSAADPKAPAANGRGAICKMAHTGPINYCAAPASLENSANAALMAAAPELLAALEKLEARVDWFLSEDFAKAFDLKYNPLSEEFFELEQARAAILKAKGG